jgi:hypothetical protein
MQLVLILLSINRFASVDFVPVVETAIEIVTSKIEMPDQLFESSCFDVFLIVSEVLAGGLFVHFPFAVNLAVEIRFGCINYIEGWDRIRNSGCLNLVKN